jgi:uncharacterized protein YndB with AHSA1/START domain
MTDHIATASTIIKASPDEVWAVLIDPERVPDYLLGSEVDTTWQVGSPIVWRGEYEGKSYEDHGTVLEASPARVLSMTHFSPLTGREDVPENYHTVTYELEGDGGSTRVTLTQDNNETLAAMEHSETNWRTVLDALKKAVES